ncbi:hypothetical protein D1B31_06280 [Neobacillus notoginsengisoli]|uniref:Uncharacterized protein n=1 Tax=Neobacillus notoginsengisoli TaxID=1578198 RepID=A0A417YXD8_9BACI|nr:hypothetical protein D1B31_06280 [Neobacillus notoginsengisoli]
MIEAEGTKTPAGCSGKVETPQAQLHRGGSTDAPRKAKCLVTGKKQHVTAMIIQGSFPLWSGNQQPKSNIPLNKVSSRRLIPASSIIKILSHPL